MTPDPIPTDLAAPLAAAADRVGIFARRLLWYTDLPSTSTHAARLAETGADEGTVVMADSQSAGRGRLGRTWSSPPGAGLYMSIVLRPGPDALDLLTLTAGLAVADGIQAATGFATAVKWPNDILANGRKLAGILAEGGTSAGRTRHVILGVGINLRPAAHPPAVASRATCLETELGRSVDRGLLLAECLASLADRYAELRARNHESILSRWRERAAATLGRRVEWDAEGGVRSGVAEDVDKAGALLVRTPSGVSRVISGEVRWI